jgi:hypothetical protein
MCLQSITVCLQQNDSPGHTAVTPMLVECARLCQETTDMAAADPEGCLDVARECAMRCESLADACDALEDPEMSECAVTLRECSDACRALEAIPA